MPATLGELRDELADRLGYASMALTDVPTLRMLTSLLKRAQETLYWQYSWDDLVQVWTNLVLNGAVDAAGRFITTPLELSAAPGDSTPWELEPRRVIDVWLSEADGRLRAHMREGIPSDRVQGVNDRSTPTHYEFRRGGRMELSPRPDVGEELTIVKVKAYAKLQPFDGSSDVVTLDEGLVFALALAYGKAQLGQPDANVYAEQAQAMLSRLRAYAHGGRRYQPGNEESRTQITTPRPVRV